MDKEFQKPTSLDPNAVQGDYYLRKVISDVKTAQTMANTALSQAFGVVKFAQVVEVIPGSWVHHEEASPIVSTKAKCYVNYDNFNDRLMLVDMSESKVTYYTNWADASDFGVPQGSWGGPTTYKPFEHRIYSTGRELFVYNGKTMEKFADLGDSSLHQAAFDSAAVKTFNDLWKALGGTIQGTGYYYFDGELIGTGKDDSYAKAVAFFINKVLNPATADELEKVKGQVSNLQTVADSLSGSVNSLTVTAGDLAESVCRISARSEFEAYEKAADADIVGNPHIGLIHWTEPNGGGVIIQRVVDGDAIQYVPYSAITKGSRIRKIIKKTLEVGDWKEIIGEDVSINASNIKTWNGKASTWDLKQAVLNRPFILTDVIPEGAAADEYKFDQGFYGEISEDNKLKVGFVYSTPDGLGWSSLEEVNEDYAGADEYLVEELFRGQTDGWQAIKAKELEDGTYSFTLRNDFLWLVISKEHPEVNGLYKPNGTDLELVQSISPKIPQSSLLSASDKSKLSGIKDGVVLHQNAKIGTDVKIDVSDGSYLLGDEITIAPCLRSVCDENTLMGVTIKRVGEKNTDCNTTLEAVGIISLGSNLVKGGGSPLGPEDIVIDRGVKIGEGVVMVKDGTGIRIGTGGPEDIVIAGGVYLGKDVDIPSGLKVSTQPFTAIIGTEYHFNNGSMLGSKSRLYGNTIINYSGAEGGYAQIGNYGGFTIKIGSGTDLPANFKVVYKKANAYKALATKDANTLYIITESDD